MRRSWLLVLATGLGLLVVGMTGARADAPPTPDQVVTWAMQHAGAAGMDAGTLAEALLASGYYESGLQDILNRGHSGAQGPFQFYGPTLATAQAEGFNIHTVGGALDAFAASGDLQLGVQAYRRAQAQGADLTTALHAFYLAMERPGATEDAIRYQRGDWAAAVAFAQGVLGQGLQPAVPPPTPVDLPSALSGLATAAGRAARASETVPRRWPSGAVGPPGQAVGDTLVDANGVTYVWDGTTWVRTDPSPPASE